MKRNYIVYLFCFGITLGLITPSFSQTNSDDLITLDVIKDFKKEKELRLSEVVDRVEYIKLETVPGSQFGKSQFVIGEKYILVIQTYFPNPVQLYLFERSGKFLRKIGRHGKGPEEYLILMDVLLSPDEDYIIVHDANKKVFLEYDISGKMLKRVNYPETIDSHIQSIRFIENGNLLFVMKRPYIKKENFNLIRIFDKNYDLLNEMFPVKSEKVNMKSGLVGTGRDSYYIKNNKFHIRESYYNKLYVQEGNTFKAKYDIYIKDKPPGYFVPVAKSSKLKYTSVSHLWDIGDYFIIGIKPNKRGNVDYNVFYNKKTGEKYRLTAQKTYNKEESDSGLSFGSSGKNDKNDNDEGAIYNDIDGFFNIEVKLFSLTPEKYIVNDLTIIDLKEYIDNEDYLENDIKFPGKRKELVDLVNSSSEDDNPILQVFHLKK